MAVRSVCFFAVLVRKMLYGDLGATTPLSGRRLLQAASGLVSLTVDFEVQFWPSDDSSGDASGMDSALSFAQVRAADMIASNLYLHGALHCVCTCSAFLLHVTLAPFVWHCKGALSIWEARMT